MPRNDPVVAAAKRHAKEALRERICKLWHEDELSMAQIEVIEKVAKSTVQGIIDRFYRAENFQAKVKKGRPSVMSKRCEVFTRLLPPQFCVVLISHTSEGWPIWPSSTILECEEDDRHPPPGGARCTEQPSCRRCVCGLQPLLVHLMSLNHVLCLRSRTNRHQELFRRCCTRWVFATQLQNTNPYFRLGTNSPEESLPGSTWHGLWPTGLR